MKRIFIITLLLCITGCQGTPDRLKPLNYVFNHMPEYAPETYKIGWQQGCESGMTVKSNDFYKSFYRLKQEPTLIHDPYYYRAWKSSFDYCRTYVYGMLKEAGMRSKLPGNGGGIPKPIGVLQIMDNWGAQTSDRW